MTINYELPDDLHRALKAQAAMQGITLKEYIIALLLAGSRAVADANAYPSGLRP